MCPWPTSLPRSSASRRVWQPLLPDSVRGRGRHAFLEAVEKVLRRVEDHGLWAAAELVVHSLVEALRREPRHKGQPCSRWRVVQVLGALDGIGLVAAVGLLLLEPRLTWTEDYRVLTSPATLLLRVVSQLYVD
jgi:hypothetical protein